MADKPQPNDTKPGTSETPAGAHPGARPYQRPSDTRDTMADLNQRAQALSREAGGRVSSAMRDAIGTAAGLAGFAVESARDLVQYMVRRGQMTQEEADAVLHDAEEAQRKRGGPERPRAVARPPAAERAGATRSEPHASAVPSPLRRASGKHAAAKSAGGAEKSRKAEKPDRAEKTATVKATTAAAKRASVKASEKKSDSRKPASRKKR